MNSNVVAPSTLSAGIIILHLLCEHSYAQQIIVPKIRTHYYPKIPLLSQQNQTRACPLATLETRLAEVNKVCCFAQTAPGTKCGNQSALACNVDCAMLLVPLMYDCQSTFDLLYDPLDEERDGHATIFDAALKSCKAIPSKVVLDELVQLHKKRPWVCTEKLLNNVAKTKVLPPPCVDVNPQCAAGIAVNFISCASAAGMCDKTCKLCTPGNSSATRVCQDTNPKCAAGIAVGFINCATQHGICDKTCKKCQGGRRRAQEHTSAHRRAQGFPMLTPCKLASFAAEMTKLNAACCDEPGMCKTGVPHSCDAKCAITFVEFYNRCHRELSLQVGVRQVKEFKQLHDTCTKRLPAEALLRAVATCRHTPHDHFKGLTKAHGMKVLQVLTRMAMGVKGPGLISWDHDSSGYVSDGGHDMYDNGLYIKTSSCSSQLSPWHSDFRLDSNSKCFGAPGSYRMGKNGYGMVMFAQNYHNKPMTFKTDGSYGSGTAGKSWTFTRDKVTGFYAVHHSSSSWCTHNLFLLSTALSPHATYKLNPCGSWDKDCQRLENVGANASFVFIMWGSSSSHCENDNPLARKVFDKVMNVLVGAPCPAGKLCCPEVIPPAFGVSVQYSNKRIYSSKVTYTCPPKVVGGSHILFQANGNEKTFLSSYAGYYSSSSIYTVTRGSGKRAAYNTMQLERLRFEDAKGQYIEYTLSGSYRGKTLLQIVTSCMGNGHSKSSNSKSSAWTNGHCTIGSVHTHSTCSSSSSRRRSYYSRRRCYTRRRSYYRRRTCYTPPPPPPPCYCSSHCGTPRPLRIGVGDGQADSGDWALFMPFSGNAGGDFDGSNIWDFGGEAEFNNGYSGTSKIIGISSSKSPPPPPPVTRVCQPDGTWSGKPPKC